MKVIDRILFGEERGTLWFYLVLCPSFLPVVLSVLSAFKVEPLPNDFRDYVSAKDFVFAGLTLSISSLNILLSNDRTGRKVSVLGMGMLLIALLSVCLQDFPDFKTLPGTALVLILVAVSIKISHTASRTSYKDFNL